MNLVFEFKSLVGIFRVLRTRVWADPSECHASLVNASVSDITFAVSFITRILKLLALCVFDITKVMLSVRCNNQYEPQFADRSHLESSC